MMMGFMNQVTGSKTQEGYRKTEIVKIQNLIQIYSINQSRLQSLKDPNILDILDSLKSLFQATHFFELNQSLIIRSKHFS